MYIRGHTYCVSLKRVYCVSLKRANYNWQYIQTDASSATKLTKHVFDRLNVCILKNERENVVETKTLATIQDIAL